MTRSFEDLAAGAEAAPVDGWDFSWLAGRATEERPPWGYARLAAARLARAGTALDLDTGGGEVLAGMPAWPARMVAESWLPNAARAARLLRPRGGWLVAAGEGDPALPFRSGVFDLVISRHPVRTRWAEVARVLRPGGTFLSQEVGARSNAELHEAVAGPLPGRRETRGAQRSRRAAQDAGLAVTGLREATLRLEFYDIGAVIWFLRKVIWTVPGFSIPRCRARPAALHELIEAEGRFVSHATRFLIEARKPGP